MPLKTALETPVAFPSTPGINLVDGGRRSVADETGGSIEAYVSTFVCERCLAEIGVSYVDVALAELSENGAKYRFVEDQRFVKEAAGKHKCPEAEK